VFGGVRRDLMRRAAAVAVGLGCGIGLSLLLPACAPSQAPPERATGCNGATVSGALAVNIALVSDNGRCQSDLWDTGKLEAGSPCQQSTECAPTCCACGPLNGMSATAGLCDNGVCADVNTTCCAYAAYGSNPIDPLCFPQTRGDAGMD
jgi:hypothetical protein